jgi:hypothetical protein
MSGSVYGIYTTSSSRLMRRESSRAKQSKVPHWQLINTVNCYAAAIPFTNQEHMHNVQMTKSDTQQAFKPCSKDMKNGQEMSPKNAILTVVIGYR